ncbi:aspartate-semialdehyde dehydrogenase [Photobacterium sp. DNB22_13_2]
MSNLEIDQYTKLVLESIKSDDYAGYDPFDGLNSNFFKAFPSLKNSLFGLFFLQLNKRSPFNFRKLLGVEKKRNPKGIGIIILGLLQDYYRTKDNSYLIEARNLADWLLTKRCDANDWQHSCWGYHFDWKARAFYVPTGKPNIITTCYISRALYELGCVTENKTYCDIALDSAYFISKVLYTEVNGNSFYAYIPGELAFVHNASLWGAAWVAFAAKKLEDDDLLEEALKVTRESTNAQNNDGSWAYGLRSHHQFIDGFHTGYNLEALLLIKESSGSKEFDSHIENGLNFYLDNFFTDDGIAKYYNDNIYPIDMHSFSQAIITLIKVGGKKEDLILCDKLVDFATRELFISNDNQFIYHKTKYITNKINYTRWTQAWSYYALSLYNNSK